MKIKYTWTEIYNDRRYSKPWIAKLADDLKVATFGDYVGDYRGGVLVIDANEGDKIRVGQKDNRGGKGVDLFFKVVDGALVAVSKVDLV